MFRKFGFAFSGISIAFKTQSSMRSHVLISIVVIATAFFLKVSITEWCFLFLCIGLVWAGELINTAIESIVDLCSPDKHPLAGKAKDTAAAAVLILSILSIIIGCIIFIPKILNLIGT